MPRWLDQLRPLFRLRVLQLVALTTLFVVVGQMALRLKYFVLDSDIWWHLKVGDWIVDHLAVPHTGILSRTAANRPWVAYSWGYEVLLSRAYAWFGLVGLGVFGTVLTLAVTYSIYWMLRRLAGEFWMALVLTWIVCWSFLFNATPRPLFFSIALFAVTLSLLFEAHRTGRIETLYWLPVLFLVWANIHIQFIYGLFVVGLFVGVKVVQHVARAFLPASSPIAQALLAAPDDEGGPEGLRRVATLVAILAACVLATLLGPYSYHPYLVVLEYSKAKFAYSVIIELQPLGFRHYSQFLELFLTAAGFFAVGWQAREQKALPLPANTVQPDVSTAQWRENTLRLDLFKLALMTVGSVVAFRTMRDAWFVCLPAAACIADAIRAYAEDHREHPVARTVSAERSFAETFKERWLEGLGVAAAVSLMLVLIANTEDFNQRGLDRAISGGYPVNAINFLRRHPVPGPIYNNLNWGGFLMWYMPNDPVAIDGRNDLYGDQLDKIFFDSQNAEDSYKTDPYLNEAGVVLLDSHLPLAQVLTIDPRFQLVYHDEIATVFARRMDLVPQR